MIERNDSSTANSDEPRHPGFAVLVMAAVAVVGIGVLVVVTLGLAGSPVTPPHEKADAQPWRWESYRGIELKVPSDWDHSGALGPSWCASMGDESRRSSGSVGRPGVTPAVLCSSPYPPADQRLPSVGFSGSGEVGVKELDRGWAIETRKFGDVFVTVFTDNDQLRGMIVESARRVAAEDIHGCPPDHAAVIGRDFRPSPSIGTLPSADEVTSISVCRYLRSDDHLREDHGPGAPLLSASRLSGTDAERIVDVLHTAPTGTGPNAPQHCGADHAYGDELLVLRIHSDNALNEVLVRYHGCDGHGADDGTTMRQLTSDLLQPLLTGPHEPSILHGAVSRLLAAGSE